MGRYQISGPDGARYEIQAPDGASEADVAAIVSRHIGGQPAKPPVSMMEAAGRGALQGVTFGTSDEIYAGAKGAWDSITGGSFAPTYERELKGVREANDRAKSQNPLAYMGGEVAGGLALPMGSLGIAAKGANLAQRSLQGAKAGAVVGGLYGLGTAEGGEGNLAEQGIRRATHALPSAVAGGALGAAAPALVDVASAALKYPANAIQSLRNPTAAADAKVSEALARDTPATMGTSAGLKRMQERLASAQETKPGVMLADVAGENTRNLLRVAADQPSKGAERLRKTLDHRQGFQWSRIEQDVADTLADGQSFTKAVDDVTASLKEKGADLFGKAYDRPWNVTAGDDLAQFLQLPYVAKIAERTSDNIKGMTGQDKAALKPWEFLHRVKMQIDREIGSAKRAAHPDGWAVGDLVQLKRKMVDLMGQKNAPYRAALYKYGDEASLKTALERGFEEFKGTRPPELRKTLASMGEAERKMYRMGAARSLFDDIRRGNITRDRTENLFSSPEIQMKLAAIYPDQAARREFQKRLVLEAKMADTRKAVQGGSHTNKLQQQTGESGQPVEAMTSIAQAASGNLKPALGWLSRRMQSFNGMNPKVAEQVINRLMQTKPPELQLRFYKEIERAQKEPERADKIIRYILRSTGTLAGDNTGFNPR